MRATLLICVLAFIMNIVFPSCQNNAQDVPIYKTKEELTEWIKSEVIKTIKDSVSAKSVEIEEWTYIATANVDTIRDFFVEKGLFNNADKDNYSEFIINVDEHEHWAYKTLDGGLYLLGGFCHEPYTVYRLKEIHMGGENERPPFCLRTNEVYVDSVHIVKDPYVNYWQLNNNGRPVSFRAYFGLWHSFVGWLPQGNSYIAACKYKCTGSPKIDGGWSVFFINGNGVVFHMIPMLDFAQIMRIINKDYWWSIIESFPTEYSKKYMDSLLPVHGGFVDKFGTEYNRDGEEFRYGKDFGDWTVSD